MTTPFDIRDTSIPNLLYHSVSINGVSLKRPFSVRLR